MPTSPPTLDLFLDTFGYKPYGIVYIATCRATGMQYVGQTVTTRKRRWWSHCHRAKDPASCRTSYLHQAMAKYGAEAFDCELLDWAATKEELDAKERHWIATLDTKAPNGYNLKDGGANGRPHPDTIAKWKASRTDWSMPADHPWRVKGRKPWNAGVPQTPERVEQNRANALARYASGWEAPMKGKTHTPEARAKLSAAGSKPRPNRFKLYRCVETGETFSGTAAAIEAFKTRGIKIHRSAITHVCDNPNRSASGYHWISAGGHQLTPAKTVKRRTPEQRAAQSACMKQGHAEGRFKTNEGRVFEKARKAVVCVETGQIYASRALACQAITGKDGWSGYSHISGAVQSGGVAYGYHWRDANESEKKGLL